MANRSIIGDDQMKSYFPSAHCSFCEPYYGRLNFTSGSWWAESPFDWLQIDFNRTVQVCAVEIQGDVDVIAWVINFYLSFSSDGASWSNSTYENGTQVVSLTRWATSLLLFLQIF